MSGYGWTFTPNATPDYPLTPNTADSSSSPFQYPQSQTPLTSAGDSDLLNQFPPSTVPAYATIPFRVNLPMLTQFVTGKNFHYFKLRLYDIDRFFTEKKGWNRDYPPGQKIYSDGATCAALRAAISTEHSVVYSGRNGRVGNEEGVLQRTPKAFFDLLSKYEDEYSPGFSEVHSVMKASFDFLLQRPTITESGVPIYTYVLMDKSLRFSRSGAGTSVDMSSKHALHAGAKPEVVYAGEFWIEPDTVTGEKTLFIDNNSGTFAPSGTELFRMKLLMEANFPGIKVVVLDYQDPEWKRRRKKDETPK